MTLKAMNTREDCFNELDRLLKLAVWQYHDLVRSFLSAVSYQLADDLEANKRTARTLTAVDGALTSAQNRSGLNRLYRGEHPVEVQMLASGLEETLQLAEYVRRQTAALPEELDERASENLAELPEDVDRCRLRLLELPPDA